MRILVVTNMYPSPAHPALGGFVRDQVEALRALDEVEVELFAFEPGGPGAYLRAAAALRRRHGRERFDIIHAHYGLTGWCALALPGPHVVTFHGTDLEHRSVGSLGRALARLIRLPAPVSATLARSALGAQVGRRSLAVLPCGVDLERFGVIDRADARRRLGLDPSVRYLLFPADPARPEKRHDRARAVADALPGTRLLTYEGIEPQHVPLAINAANAVLSTSEREGFGLAPLEALACDVPVLATPVGIAPFALRGIAGSLCAPFELGAWTRAARAHLDEPDPRIAGRARAALFDRHRLAERVLMAYRDIAVAGAEQPQPPVGGAP